MSVAKVIEVSASSPKSFEDAIARGIARVHSSVDEVQGAWVQEQKVMVKDGKVEQYRVNMKVTFVVQDAAAETLSSKRKKK